MRKHDAIRTGLLIGGASLLLVTLARKAYKSLQLNADTIGVVHKGIPEQLTGETTADRPKAVEEVNIAHGKY